MCCEKYSFNLTTFFNDEISLRAPYLSESLSATHCCRSLSILELPCMSTCVRMCLCAYMCAACLINSFLIVRL